ncbi:hypothetical protein D3C85_1908830 [compost metagenome]
MNAALIYSINRFFIDIDTNHVFFARGKNSSGGKTNITKPNNRNSLKTHANSFSCETLRATQMHIMLINLHSGDG